MASAAAGEADDEPIAKKPKTEECLIPEAQFLAQNKVTSFMESSEESIDRLIYLNSVI